MPEKIDEQLFRTLIEGIRDYAILMLDTEGRVVNWTAAAEQVSGYSAEAITGQSFARFHTADDVEREHPDEILRVATREGHFEEDGWRVRGDGSQFWANVTVSALRDEGGSLRGFCLVMRDISVRMKTEEKLRESQRQLRAMIDGIRDHAILMLDPEGRVLNWSEGARRVKGYEAGEILGRNFSCFYPPEEIERGHPQQVLQRASEDGHYEEEGWRVRKDGSRFWAIVTITAQRDDSGVLHGFSKITRDITERRRAEEELRESLIQFRAVLESAPDAMVIFDEKGEIVLVNAETERLFGYRREDIVGMPVETLIADDSRASYARGRSESDHVSGSRQMGSRLEINGLRRDGGEFTMEISVGPMETHNKAWIAASIRDVTERRAMEQLVAERKTAEEANRSKSAFLAAMSHEIRTPMNAILGMSDLLWESDLNSEQRQFVEIFRRAGANLLVLIDNILDLSKIDAGHFELEQRAFSLGEVLEQTVDLVGGGARKKGIELRVCMAPGIGSDLVGDPGRLRQVLLNLVGNAIKFTDAGEIVVTVQPQEGGGPGAFTFSVSDTGIGIAPEKLLSIFDDFAQADSSMTRRYGGTGLGLGISRRIVEQMGGSLTVTSSPQNGSTFTFTVTFPRAERRVGRELDDLQGRPVLVVDDNSTNRLVLQECLASWGMESTSWGTAVEALKDLELATNRRRPYALAILDDRMPGTSGLETAAAMRKIEPDLPLIMLSSEAISAETFWLTQVGVGHAVKPVNRADLLRLVCDAVGSLWITAAPTQPVAALLRQLNDCPPIEILVAEDAPDNRVLVQAYLKSGLYNLTMVEDGQSAVEQFAARTFDLVLMDMQMPIMDGLTATSKIRELERERGGRRTPIVALTAYARQVDIEMSKEAGCDSHLSKPISKAKLVATIVNYWPQDKLPAAATNSPDLPDGEDVEDFDYLVPDYLAARRLEMVEMNELLTASDFARLGVLAHNLKGSGLSYGFPDLTRLGGELEQFATDANTDAAGELLEQLGDCLRGVAEGLTLRSS